MKKYCIFLTVFVLTVSLFTGCGCTPGGGNEGPSLPTRNTTPMIPETNVPATVPSESATTVPNTRPIETMIPSESESGMVGTEATGDITDSTGPSAEGSARSRRMR